MRHRLDAGLPALAGWGRWICAAADAGRTGLAFGSGGGSVLVDRDSDLDKVEGRGGESVWSAAASSAAQSEPWRRRPLMGCECLRHGP